LVYKELATELITLRQLVSRNIDDIYHEAGRVFLESAIIRKECMGDDGKVDVEKFIKRVKKDVADYDDLFNPGIYNHDEETEDKNIRLFAALPVDDVRELSDVISYYCY